MLESIDWDMNEGKAPWEQLQSVKDIPGGAVTSYVSSTTARLASNQPSDSSALFPNQPREA